jgi:hypothetical protein
VSALSAKHALDETTADALCHQPFPNGFPSVPEKARTPSCRKPSNSRHPKAQDTFHRKVPLTPPFARAPGFALGPPLIPRFGRRSPASDMLSRPFWFARPTCLPAIHRGAWATCRPSTSAVGRPTSTPSNSPNTALSMVAHRGTTDDSLAGLTCRALTGQGALCATAFAAPRQTTARPTDLPRPDRPGHPLSQVGAKRGLETSTSGGRAVYDLFRTHPPGSPRFHAVCRVGPSLLPSRERKQV